MTIFSKRWVNYVYFIYGFLARMYLTHVSEDPGCPSSSGSGTDDFIWQTIGLALFGGEDTPCWPPFDEGRTFLQIGISYNPVLNSTDVCTSIHLLTLLIHLQKIFFFITKPPAEDNGLLHNVWRVPKCVFSGCRFLDGLSMPTDLWCNLCQKLDDFSPSSTRIRHRISDTKFAIAWVILFHSRK